MILTLHVIVVDIRVIETAHRRPLVTQHRRIGRLLPTKGLGDPVDGLTPPGDPTTRLIRASGMEEHEVPDRSSRMPSRQRVVADIENAATREKARAVGEETGPCFIRDPGIETVSDDIVELTELVTEPRNTPAMERAIADSRGLTGLDGPLDLPLREIDTDTLGLRQTERHGQEVTARRGSELEYTGRLDIRCIDPEQGSRRRQDPGMCMEMHAGGVWQLFVAGIGHRNRSSF